MRRARKGGKMRVSRPLSTQNATIKETLDIGYIQPGGLNYRTFSLSNFFRATSMAYLFKFYRAKSVTWSYEPSYNDYTNTAAGTSPSIPQLFTVMNRTSDTLPASSVSLTTQMLSQGAKAKLLNRKHVLKYVPNWCSAGNTVVSYDATTKAVNGIGQTGLKIEKGWMACPDADVFPTSNPANDYISPTVDGNLQTAHGLKAVNNWPGNVPYSGHFEFISQAGPNVYPIGRLFCTVIWEFKNPNLWVQPPTGVADVSGVKLPIEL